MTIEPLPYASERHTWHVHIVWLMGTLMNHEAIDTVGELTIGHILQVAWIVGIGLSTSAWSCHRLSSCDVLSVDVCYRSRLLIIRIIHTHIRLSVGTYWHPRGSNPHSTHRYFCGSFEVHTIAHVGTSAFMALCVATFHAVFFFSDLGKQGVVISDQLTNGGTPVEEEGITLCR